MGKEINLLKEYPKSKRNLKDRKNKKNLKIISKSREFGRDYFDGDRIYGYGGYSYNKKFWGKVVKTFIQYYNLKDGDSILDIGCAKGYMLFDFKNEMKSLNTYGIDISSYAIENSENSIKPYLKVGNAIDLPYPNHYFDLVISINTIHNLDENDCAKAIKEINRVSKKNSFLTVDAYENDNQKSRMDDWNLTALTYKSTKNWKKFFDENDYKGDYYWFIP